MNDLPGTTPEDWATRFYSHLWAATPPRRREIHLAVAAVDAAQATIGSTLPGWWTKAAITALLTTIADRETTTQFASALSATPSPQD